MMLGWASHDVSAMREMLGVPQWVLAAQSWNGGSYVHTMLDFGLYTARGTHLTIWRRSRDHSNIPLNKAFVYPITLLKNENFDPRAVYVDASLMGADQQLRCDSHVLLASPAETLRRECDGTSYIYHLPPLLFRGSTTQEMRTRTKERRSFLDRFVAELDVVCDAVTQGVRPKSSATDFIHDLTPFEDTIAAIKSSV